MEDKCWLQRNESLAKGKMQNSSKDLETGKLTLRPLWGGPRESPASLIEIHAPNQAHPWRQCSGPAAFGRTKHSDF